MAAPSNATIAQKCQQLEREVAKLKAYAARQAGAEAARPPKPRPVRGDLRKPAGLAKVARVVRTSPDGVEGALPCFNTCDVITTSNQSAYVQCWCGGTAECCGGRSSGGAAELCLIAAWRPRVVVLTAGPPSLN